MELSALFSPPISCTSNNRLFYISKYLCPHLEDFLKRNEIDIKFEMFEILKHTEDGGRIQLHELYEKPYLKTVLMNVYSKLELLAKHIIESYEIEGPPYNPCKIDEIYEVPLECKRDSILYNGIMHYLPNERKFLVKVNENLSDSHARIVFGHEIGHALVKYYKDERGRVRRLFPENATEGVIFEEMIVEYFGRALAMPREEVMETFLSSKDPIKGLDDVVRKFDVLYSDAIVRIVHDLGIWNAAFATYIKESNHFKDTFVPDSIVCSLEEGEKEICIENVYIPDVPKFHGISFPWKIRCGRECSNAYNGGSFYFEFERQESGWIEANVSDGIPYRIYAKIIENKYGYRKESRIILIIIPTGRKGEGVSRIKY